jgi:hypothetical protein
MVAHSQAATLFWRVLPFAQHDLSSCIEANEVQRILPGIDTNGDDGGVKLA